MAQVLQDIADMAVDFKRLHGYLLPTFDVQYVSSTNSSSSYRVQPSHLQKAYNNCQLDQKNLNAGIARENTSKRAVPQPLSKVPPKYKIHKGKTA